MKQRKVFASLVSLAAVISVIASPQAAAAAECVYNRQDLPLPAGVTSARTEGSSTNNSRIVGSYSGFESVARAALWVNSTLRVLPGAVEPFRHVYPKSVNNTSVVVGHQEWRTADRAVAQAFRYENGAYTFLQTAEDENSNAVAVNDAGDVLGLVWKRENAVANTVVMWPRNGARQSFGEGNALGLSGRKIVKYDRASQHPLIIDADTGATVAVPDAPASAVVDNERLLGFEWVGENTGQLTEWDLGGIKVNDHRGGYQAFGRNNSGTVFGTILPWVGGGPTLWRTNSRSPVVADKLPSADYYADVTDAATLIASYVDDAGSARPARWLWQCS